MWEGPIDHVDYKEFDTVRCIIYVWERWSWHCLKTWWKEKQDRQAKVLVAVLWKLADE